MIGSLPSAHWKRLILVIGRAIGSDAVEKTGNGTKSLFRNGIDPMEGIATDMGYRWYLTRWSTDLQSQRIP